MRTFFAVAAISTVAQAFWGTAHLLIARRAQDLLETSNPDALNAALAVLAPLAQYYPDLVEEGSHPFTECATFADNIKGEGYSWQADWHFINIPYYDEGGDASDWPDFVQSDVDVVQALDALTKFLKGDSSADSTTYVQQIQDAFSYPEDQQSFALRLVIHYAGDIHQPLHDTAEVDSTYPSGDRGGNDEHIASIDGVSNMHSVWDSVIYTYTGYVDLPLSSSDWDWYTSESRSLGDEYPIDASEVEAGQYSTWADENLVIAEDDVYAGFSDPVTDEYKNIAKPILEKRMMLGGKRLEEMIIDIYGSTASAWRQAAEAFLQ